MQNPFGNGNNNNDQNPFDLNNLPLPPNYAKIVNDQGQMRIAKVGFSWTTLWFGPLPALFRGDYYNFLLMIVLDLDYALVVLFFGLNWLMQFPWPSIIFGAIYNMMFSGIHLTSATDRLTSVHVTCLSGPTTLRWNN